MIKPQDELLTLEEAAEYLRISYRSAKKTHLSWEKFGVKTYRPPFMKRGFRFKTSEILRMVEMGAIN
ncbi:MAG TPA: hypothetical protein V6D12_14270 [Candidatus Obscuribacterales bacterium]